jgi:Putative redox-active protein (C_GCAxxG_C_C)
MSVVDRSFDHPLKLEEQASTPLAGGIMLHGYQCGMLWGVTLAAGAQAYRRLGPGPQAETSAILAAQRLVESFRAQTKNEINCLEITDLNMQGKIEALPILKFFVKGGPIGCFRMAARYAPVAFNEIDSALSEEDIEAPSPPVSCAAVLAQKMDVSEMHGVMAAGLAGGIGLSGGACGALGAAIWIIEMDSDKELTGKDGFENPRALAAIDKFLKTSDYKFECSEIVGRRFENIDDHAAYLRAGGCSEIIEALGAN